MGTRALTKVVDQNGTVLVTIYQQTNGYPDCHGAELAKFLSKIKVVNGLSSDNRGVANGPGCLAAQLVKLLKDGPGGVYIAHPEAQTEAWVYVINVGAVGMHGVAPLSVTVYRYGDELFRGDPESLSKWIDHRSGRDESF